MLMETKLYEVWETERIHRIGLSFHEIEQILHALEYDKDYKGVDKGYHSIADRLRRMKEKVIAKHNLEGLKRLD